MTGAARIDRWVGGVYRFLRRHPILFLLLLTPGIPEYLSGSSSLEPLVLNPVAFLLFLPLNLALYGPGVLLIREAKVRWHRGWASVIALGAAYAILEEGIAVDTFFNPRAGPVGALGSFGHFLGVNWVWVTGIVMVHVVYSISLPILLHGWALPEWRGKSLLSRRGIGVAFVVLGLDVVVLEVFVVRVSHFWFGLPLLAGSLVAIAGLAFLAWRLPSGLLQPTRRAPGLPRWVLFPLGVALLSGTFLLESIRGLGEYGPAVTIAALVAFYATLLALCRRALGPSTNVRGVVTFSAGALGFLMIFGLLSEFRLPVVVVADGAAGLFLYHLWKRYPDPMPPPGGSPALRAVG